MRLLNLWKIRKKRIPFGRCRHSAPSPERVRVPWVSLGRSGSCGAREIRSLESSVRMGGRGRDGWQGRPPEGAQGVAVLRAHGAWDASS